MARCEMRRSATAAPYLLPGRPSPSSDHAAHLHLPLIQLHQHRHVSPARPAQGPHPRSLRRPPRFAHVHHNLGRSPLICAVNLPRRRTTKGPLDLDECAPPAISLTPTYADYNSPLSPSSPPPTPAKMASPPPPTPMPLAPPKDLSFLMQPQLFHPLPPSSHPAPFLALPPPPVSSSPSQLLASLHLRAAAIAAANAITATPSPAPQELFALWHTRLTALLLLGPPHAATAAQEVKAFSDLSSSFYRDPATGAHIVPWALRVLSVRLQSHATDWRRGISSYYELAREARTAALDPALPLETRTLWRQRLSELGVRVASACVELGDLACAVRALGSLQGEGVAGMRALVLVRAGMGAAAAAECGDATVRALVAMVEGRWEEAVDEWAELAEAEAGGAGAEMARCNWAVCELYQGKLKQARETLEGLIDEGIVFPGLVFNLATIYELCGDGSKKLKLQLAEKVAATGREMTNVSFKM
ncbi:hypothetical protein EDC01DRAFT_167726 [Geopyxis carbonaria]|nr:hypothetical protein EDC01DRAFT_167726 [Geopyxis carbonaria]